MTLDPANWDELRTLAHRMLDDMLDFQATVRERAPWQPIPAEVKQTLQAPPPEQPRDAADVYQDFQETILPYPTGQHPPALLGLGDRHRRPDQRAGGAAGRDHEPQRGRRRNTSPTTWSFRS